jgi:hypothetical protein
LLDLTTERNTQDSVISEYSEIKDRFKYVVILYANRYIQSQDIAKGKPFLIEDFDAQCSIAQTLLNLTS